MYTSISAGTGPQVTPSPPAFVSSILPPSSRPSLSKAEKPEPRLGVVTDFLDFNLHSACVKGDLGLATFAVTQGQPVNSLLNGLLPIHAAASGGNENILRFLLEHQADPNATRAPRKYITDKHRSLKAGTTGATPLHFAAANNHCGAIEVLVSYGANPLIADKYGVTPLILAEQNGYTKASDLLRLAETEFDTASVGSAPSSSHQPHASNNITTLPNFLSASGNSLAAPSFRRGSVSSGSSPHRSNRRPSLPSVFEKGSNPVSVVKNAVGKLTNSAENPLRSVKKSTSKLSLNSSIFSAKDGDSESNSGTGFSRVSTFDEDDASSRGLFGLPKFKSRNNTLGRSRHGSVASSNTSLPLQTHELSSPGSNSILRTRKSSAVSLDPNSSYRPRQSSQLSWAAVPSTSRLSSSENTTNNRTRDPSPADSSMENKVDSGETPTTQNTISIASGTFALPQTETNFQKQPQVETLRKTDTRSSRSDSAVSSTKFSSSPSSSYSGVLSNYAPSTSTATTSPSIGPPSVSLNPVNRPHGSSLSPLYKKTSQMPTIETITTEEARTRVKLAKQELLNHSVSDTTSQNSQALLQQRLAEYGRSLSLEKRAKVNEKNNAGNSVSKGYSLETIKSHSSTSTPTTGSTELLHEPDQSVEQHNLTLKTSDLSFPQWRAIPTPDRLMPPPVSDGRRSVTPSSTSSRNRDSSPSKQEPDGVTYVPVTSPVTSNILKPKKSRSDKAQSQKSSSVTTSIGDQLIMDAYEKNRMDASIPQASPITGKKSIAKRLFSKS